MSRVKRWRVTDVVKAVCKERGVGWEWYSSCEGEPFSADAWFVIASARRSGGSFEYMARMGAPRSLRHFFGVRRIAVTDADLDRLADVIVAEARRLRVPRRAT